MERKLKVHFSFLTKLLLLFLQSNSFPNSGKNNNIAYWGGFKKEILIFDEY